MKTKYIIPILSCLLPFGCADGSTYGSGDCVIPNTVATDDGFVKGKPEYRFYIDRNFPQEQKLLIISAINDWQIATGDMIKYTLQFSDLSKDDKMLKGSNTIKIFKSESTSEKWYGFTTWKLDLSVANITILNGITDTDIFTNVILHELGHAFGLEHEDKYEAVMFLFSDGTRTQVYCADVKAFCEIHGCNIDCKLEVEDYSGYY
jgi:hypothetical protein